MAETTHVVQLDSRGRLSLGRYATSELYVVYVYDSGRIVLEPASVVSALERISDSPDPQTERVAMLANVTVDEVTGVGGLP